MNKAVHRTAFFLLLYPWGSFEFDKSKSNGEQASKGVNSGLDP